MKSTVTKFDKVILVTGGNGFIGGAFLRMNVPVYDNYLFINVDDLRDGSNEMATNRVSYLPNYRFEKVSLEEKTKVEHIFLKYEVTDVIHFAAESDVDRSIRKPDQTVISNIFSTLSLLEGVRAMRNIGVKFNRFVYVSTDEVYGDASLDPLFPGFTETDQINPKNPYAASKAAAEHLVQSYGNTYGLDFVITRGCNTFGPWQAPTKLIPRAVKELMEGRNIPLYGKGLAVREWIPVDDHAEGIFKAWQKGRSGSVYNIGTGVPCSGITVAHSILAGLGLDENYIEFVADRPGHDMRYKIDSSKARGEKLIRKFDIDIQDQIGLTAQWYEQYFSTLQDEQGIVK